MRLTIWHKGTDKPVRDGVYQRVYPRNIIFFCKFFAGDWYCGCCTSRLAETDMFVSFSQHLKWRGITKDGK